MIDHVTNLLVFVYYFDLFLFSVDACHYRRHEGRRTRGGVGGGAGGDELPGPQLWCRGPEHQLGLPAARPAVGSGRVRHLARQAVRHPVLRALLDPPRHVAQQLRRLVRSFFISFSPAKITILLFVPGLRNRPFFLLARHYS